nr:hypothetical protein [Tanacetum cinerariifolium]
MVISFGLRSNLSQVSFRSLVTCDGLGAARSFAALRSSRSHGLLGLTVFYCDQSLLLAFVFRSSEIDLPEPKEPLFTLQRLEIALTEDIPGLHANIWIQKNDIHKVAEKPWVKVSVGHTGFYRVKYDSAAHSRIEESHRREMLVTMVWVKTGLVDPEHLLSKKWSCPFHFIVIVIAVRFIVILTDLILSSTEKLGLEAVSRESHLTTMVREEVFMALVDFDHKEAHEELKNRFQTL